MFRQTLAVLAVLIAGTLPIAAQAQPAQPPIFGASERYTDPLRDSFYRHQRGRRGKARRGKFTQTNE